MDVYSCSFLYTFMLLWHKIKNKFIPKWQLNTSYVFLFCCVFVCFFFFFHSSCSAKLREYLHVNVRRGTVGTSSLPTDLTGLSSKHHFPVIPGKVNSFEWGALTKESISSLFFFFSCLIQKLKVGRETKCIYL